MNQSAWPVHMMAREKSYPSTRRMSFDCSRDIVEVYGNNAHREQRRLYHIGVEEHGKQVIVQCKRYAPGSAIGSRDIQNFIGMMNVHHKAEKGIFVTTSKFTKPAIDLAEKHKILLLARERFLSLMQAMQGNLQPN